MRMSDFVVREAIIPELAADTREGVVREMVSALHAAGRLKAEEVDEVVRLVLRREQLGSTGIGRGIAIPHTKHAGVDRLVGTLTLSPKGVAFQSIDGEAVHVFVMLVSPTDRPDLHLRALDNVVRCMRDDSFVRALRQARTRDEVWQLLDDADPRRDW